MAYFHEVCLGDRDVSFASLEDDEEEATSKHATMIPLYMAVRRAREGSSDAGEVAYGGFVPPANQQQMADTASWLADRTFQDAWQMVPKKKRAEMEATGMTYDKHFRDLSYAHAVFTRTLLPSPHFHSLTVSDMDRAQRLVAHLVRLDRLPKADTLEGLLLLREAWCAYDVAMHLADRYKLLSKFLFLVQQIVIWLIIMLTYMSMYLGATALSDAQMCSHLESRGWLARTSSLDDYFPECHEPKRTIPTASLGALPFNITTMSLTLQVCASGRL